MRLAAVVGGDIGGWGFWLGSSEIATICENTLFLKEENCLFRSLMNIYLRD